MNHTIIKNDLKCFRGYFILVRVWIHLVIYHGLNCSITVLPFGEFQGTTLRMQKFPNDFRYLQIIKQKDYHGTTELKLGGCPWWAEGNDAVESRYFISSLIGALKASGWAVAGTINLSRHNNDKSTFLLRRCHAQVRIQLRYKQTLPTGN